MLSRGPTLPQVLNSMRENCWVVPCSGISIRMKTNNKFYYGLTIIIAIISDFLTLKIKMIERAVCFLGMFWQYFFSNYSGLKSLLTIFLEFFWKIKGRLHRYIVLYRSYWALSGRCREKYLSCSKKEVHDLRDSLQSASSLVPTFQIEHKLIGLYFRWS